MTTTDWTAERCGHQWTGPEGPVHLGYRTHTGTGHSCNLPKGHAGAHKCADHFEPERAEA